MARCARLLLFALCLPLPAVIIDRIVVTVGNQAITQSELDRAVRLTAFVQSEPLDFSPQNRRRVADRLVEQKLVLKELDFGRLPVPTPADVELAMRHLRISRYHDNEGELQRALLKYGITEDELKQYLLKVLTLLRFIDFRFRPGIQVSEDDIEEYFKTKVAPFAALASPGKPVLLEDYHDRIDRILAGQRETKAMEEWLNEARSRTKIEYREDAFQ